VDYVVQHLDEEGIIDTSVEHAMSLKNGGNGSRTGTK